METTKEKHATHTPGPWELVQERDYLNIQETKTNLIVAQFCSVSEANARLIAAAPELLEQCKLFEKVLRACIMAGDSGAELERDKLREVLAKVDGGEG
jgi:phage-related baseplate assembly protein